MTENFKTDPIILADVIHKIQKFKRVNPENLLNLKTNGLLVFVFNYHFQYKLSLRSFQNSMYR